MARCFFIGIGGTGAKCAEALIHLCAAGLGPDRCSIMLVDQDEPNGNGERCRRLLEAYVQLYGLLSHQGAGAGPHLFHTDVAAPAGGVFWCPSARQGARLHDICNYGLLSQPQRELVDCLYLPSEREQTLDMGFRARPSVGAAVLLAQTLEGDAFWQTVFESIDEARRGEPVKIFLLGSIFGGTGAAGLPTFARLIRRAVADRTGDKVAIGGGLVLPYFYFPAPPRQDRDLLPDSAAFLEQTQGALGYYHRLFAEEALFDNLYAIGWQPLLEIKAYKEGGKEQRNPALLPELFAGLCALRFFASDDPAPVTYFGREPSSVSWMDLPQVHPPNRDEVRQALGTLLRFGHAFHSVYRRELAADRWRQHRREAWFRRLIGESGASLADPAVQGLLDLVDFYGAELLRWSANIAFGGAGDGADVRLWRAAQYARQTGDPFERAELAPAPDFQRTFGRLIESEEGPDLATIFDRLTYRQLGGERRVPANFISGLHQACAFRPR
jgi:hypothetical protein